MVGVGEQRHQQRVALQRRRRAAASAPPTFALLPAAAGRFRRRNPGARLMLQTLPAEAIAEHLLIGDIDLGLTMAILAEPQIRGEVIGAAEIVALMQPSSPLAALAAVTPADLAGQTLISYGAQTPVGQMLRRVFHEAGCVCDPHIEITLSIAAVPLVTSGLGVALVDGLVVRPFRPRSALDIVLVSSTVLPQSRSAGEFSRDIHAVIFDLGRPA